MPLVYYLWPALLTVLIALPLLVFSWYFYDIAFWENWLPGEAGKYEEFCERNRMDRLIREPSNTFSNLAYVWLGFQVLAFAIWDFRQKINKNRLQQWPLLSVVFALSLILLGGGSFFYHASLSAIAQRWDMTGVYSIMAFLLAYPVFHFFPNRKNFLLGIVTTLLLADLLLYIYKWSLNGLVVLPAFILIVVLFIVLDQVLRKPQRNMKWIFSALFFLTAAFVLWYLDRENILCNPDSLFQGHALWHCLTGWSSFSIYMFYRSESGR
ncbi:MAG: ceramidase domain-containing protein [Chitinophagales bacterium]